VLAAAAIGSRREGAGDSPHYQIHLRDAAGTSYRAAANVLSAQAPSELLYLANEDFRHPLLALLPDTAAGWSSLPPGPGRANLDFIRGNLFDGSELHPIPPDVAGPDNDLADKLDHYVQRAIADQAALVYVFGPAGQRRRTDYAAGRAGLKVHGVAYTREQAQREGWTITF
jgi:uncharacterized protein YukJ